ncbi:myo-inositol 2-dehydrogenase/D-chiro-inositol 1-dehydrogenase [Pseudarthrobacter defluvii]|uniref:Gfo/Idh/MocA family oxidoreductase n=1 Tax=Pseudarthrobacter defluvii TaxID=410837 RepID=UPI00277FF366|nr:Gfo/Idh/MocA family oxidoreductase [Pseudarthrobacter defluvii]MDQ0771114.1 myo-inositol 2-dehydrogenase/D-chiro-inositol 1-dehydrogenase [Pseudarthrobacter defluvii]
MSSQAVPATRPLGVGILGAGPVTQAIHLPALARLQDVLEVRHIMDVDAGVASSVAARVGGKSGTSMDALLNDPGVDIVAICSPHQFHADQVIAACRAGKKAVLCEKPFAMNAEEATRISAVSTETGVPIVVGAMHTFDPGWLAAEQNWGDLPERVHTVRSSIVLPPNARFEDFATEIITRPTAGKPDYSDIEVIKSALQGGIMGLAIHDLPLVRRFTPDFADIEVLNVFHVRPFGYAISLRTPTRVIELRAVMNSTWKPEWTFEAIGDDAALQIDFTPSYVQAGSAAATISRGNGSETSIFGPYGHNGYEGEWRVLAELAMGTRPAPSAQTLIDDLTFALAVADATVARAAAGHEGAAEKAGVSA